MIRVQAENLQNAIDIAEDKLEKGEDVTVQVADLDTAEVFQGEKLGRSGDKN